MDFEEELKKFQPCLELGEMEEALYKQDIRDMADVMVQLMQMMEQGNPSHPER